MIRSWNSCFGPVVPRYSSRIAYPRQLRRSAEPCESQVLEDCVIQIRTQRTGMGDDARRIVTMPPLPFSTAPDENVCQVPLFGNLTGSSPVKNCTAYCVAKGSAQAIRIVSIGNGFARSRNTHWGCRESSSPVKALLRYGLLFQ